MNGIIMTYPIYRSELEGYKKDSARSLEARAQRKSAAHNRKYPLKDFLISSLLIVGLPIAAQSFT